MNARSVVASVALFAAGCTRSESAAPASSAHAAQTADTATSVVIDSATVRNATEVATDTSTTIALDTARGIVARVGPDPVSRLVLLPVPPSTAPTLALQYDARTPIDTAVGFEVMVEGTRTTERAMDAAPGGAIIFRVRRFVVRNVR